MNVLALVAHSGLRWQHPFDFKDIQLESSPLFTLVKAVESGNKNIRSIRPGHGLSPLFYDRVMGRVFNQKLDAGTALKWEYLS